MERLQIDPRWHLLLSLEDYHRLIDLGFFDEDEHMEFLEGYLTRMSPQSPRHADLLMMLDDLVKGAAAPELAVRIQMPLTLARSEPEPDLAVVDRSLPRRTGRHPATALFIIEVAGESLSRDLGIKVRLYAEADITEYWVVDVEGRRIHVFRDPDPPALAYRTTHIVDSGTLQSAALPSLAVELARVFAD